MAFPKLGAAAVPILTEALTDKDIVNCRIWAAWGLRQIGPEAKSAVPQLEITFKTDVGIVRVEAARALWAVSEHKAVVPYLIGLLKDKDADVRCTAAEDLAWIGPKAKESVPALIEALKDPGQAEFDHGTFKETKSVSAVAGKALKSIDPEAAKKAGVE